MSAVLGLIDWLAVPRGPQGYSPGVLTRRRVAAGALVIATTSALTTLVTVSTISSTASLGALVLIAGWLRLGNSHVGPAIALCLVGWLTIGIATLWQHGGTGLDSHWNLLVPLMATYVAGPRVGLAFGGLVVAEVVSWTSLVEAGWVVPRPLPRSLEIFNGMGTLSILLALGIAYDRSRARTEQDLGASLDAQRRLLAAIEAADDGVAIYADGSRLLYANQAVSCITGVAQSDFDTVSRAPARTREGAAFRDALREGTGWCGTFEGADARCFEIRVSPAPDARCTIVVVRDRTDQRRAERELADVNRKLVDASRQAGRAEVAANVLHNVGNALTSMSVTTSVVATIARTSKSHGVMRAVTLLRDHEADLARFLTDDDRGRRLPAYLAQVAVALEEERTRLAEETASLQRNMEHVIRAVAQQQKHATPGHVTETVRVSELVPHILELADVRSHAVEVHFDGDAALATDRTRLVDVVANLVKNARESVEAAGRPDGCVSVSVRTPSPETVEIQVSDNGVGISPEALPNLFTHGFTTKPSGHGFGLHDCACAARSLGGHITARSAGPGCGATFVLTLPALPAEEAPR